MNFYLKNRRTFEQCLSAFLETSYYYKINYNLSRVLKIVVKKLLCSQTYQHIQVVRIVNKVIRKGGQFPQSTDDPHAQPQPQLPANYISSGCASSTCQI